MTFICKLLGHKFVGEKHYVREDGKEMVEIIPANFCLRCGKLRGDKVDKKEHYKTMKEKLINTPSAMYSVSTFFDKKDFFAAFAMQKRIENKDICDVEIEEIVEFAYKIADKMVEHSNPTTMYMSFENDNLSEEK